MLGYLIQKLALLEVFAEQQKNKETKTKTNKQTNKTN